MIQQLEEIHGRVAAVHRERYAVHCGMGELYARLKQASYRDANSELYPTVGDGVDLIYNAQGDSLITATHPRKSIFLRIRPFVGGMQAVAANFDEVFILASLNQEFNVRRIERYVAQAWQSGGTPVVVLTKLDLAGNADQQLYETHAIAPGVDVYAVSAHTGEGMAALGERLTPGKVITLMGSSGVGKSSLVNALAGEALMAVKAIREDDARGRHTTTHRQLITLPCGVDIIDTPGMRELGLWDAEEGVKEAFEDIEALAAGCRFSDCAHQAEPGCAVKLAVEEGRLDAKRLQNYHRLQREAKRRRKIEMVKKK